MPTNSAVFDFEVYLKLGLIRLNFIMADDGFGARPSRLISSLTPEQMNKFSTMVKDSSDRLGSGRIEEYNVPDPTGMLCLKLFMAVEVVICYPD